MYDSLCPFHKFAKTVGVRTYVLNTAIRVSVTKTFLNILDVVILQWFSDSNFKFHVVLK